MEVDRSRPPFPLRSSDLLTLVADHYDEDTRNPPLIDRSASDIPKHATMRVRMRGWFLAELKEIARLDAEFLGENWTMSDCVREVLLEYIKRRRAEFEAARCAEFEGAPPPTA
jgi:hypothetical protein